MEYDLGIALAHVPHNSSVKLTLLVIYVSFHQAARHELETYSKTYLNEEIHRMHVSVEIS